MNPPRLNRSQALVAPIRLRGDGMTLLSRLIESKADLSGDSVGMILTRSIPPKSKWIKGLIDLIIPIASEWILLLIIVC